MIKAELIGLLREVKRNATMVKKVKVQPSFPVFHEKKQKRRF